MRLFFLAALTALTACSAHPTPVGVTLEDGEVLVGDITTDTLHLDGDLGALAIPLDDVGVVLPVDAEKIADSEGRVTVWLRNGSELRGTWQQPELAVGMAVGGHTVHVDLPVGDIQAVQTRGSQEWPSGALFRVQTVAGDDFLVDARRSRLPIENELGTFEPMLSECTMAVALGDGTWRLELKNGTVLLGRPKESALTFVLPMGPETLSVPLAKLARMDRGEWQPSSLRSAPEPMAEQKARPALSSGEGWFDYRPMSAAKR